MSTNNDVLEILRDIRAEVHNNVGNSVVCQLDEAISKLEETSPKQQVTITSRESLKLLVEILKWIPAIMELIDILSDVISRM